MSLIQVEAQNDIQSSGLPAAEKQQRDTAVVRSDCKSDVVQASSDDGGMLLCPEGATLSILNRLLVLIPDQDVDSALIAQKLWSLASGSGLQILLVTVVANADYKPSIERRLAVIAAMARDRRVKVETQVIAGRNWVKAIQLICQPNDLIVCQAEHPMPAGFFKLKPLYSEFLVCLNRPIYVLSGIYPEVKPVRSKWFHQIPYWAILLTIIAGFFEFEVRIDQFTKGWVENTLFALAFVIEISLIWIWNSISG